MSTPQTTKTAGKDLDAPTPPASGQHVYLVRWVHFDSGEWSPQVRGGDLVESAGDAWVIDTRLGRARLPRTDWERFA